MLLEGLHLTASAPSTRTLCLFAGKKEPAQITEKENRSTGWHVYRCRVVPRVSHLFMPTCLPGATGHPHLVLALQLKALHVASSPHLPSHAYFNRIYRSLASKNYNVRKRRQSAPLRAGLDWTVHTTTALAGSPTSSLTSTMTRPRICSTMFVPSTCWITAPCSPQTFTKRRPPLYSPNWDWVQKQRLCLH